MKKLRVGVVGLGHRGRYMVQLADEFDCTEIVAVCDIKVSNWYEKCLKTGEKFTDKYPNTVLYEDYDKMLDEANLDVVIVETGADIHAEFCIKALEKNINVLSDIPNVANLQEAEDLWKAAAKSKAIISTGANPNESKFSVLLQEFYKNGLLGKPYCMEAEYLHWSLPGSQEFISLRENGDWRKLLKPIRYCTHSLGPLLTVLDGELRTVSCFGTGPQTEESENKDDMMCAQFQTDSGAVVRLMRNGRCRAKIGQHNYRVFGTEGYIERIDRFDKPVIRYNSTKELDKELKEIGGEWMPPAYANDAKALRAGHGGMDYAMMDHFLTAVCNGDPAPITLKQGLTMTLPGIYAEISAKRGGQVMRMYYPWDKEWTVDV